MFDYWQFSTFAFSTSPGVYPFLPMLLFALLVLSAAGIYFFKPSADRPTGMIGFFQAIFARRLSSPRMVLVLVGVITVLILDVNLFNIYRAKASSWISPGDADIIKKFCVPAAQNFSPKDLIWGPGRLTTTIVAGIFTGPLNNVTDCYGTTLNFPLYWIFIPAMICWMALKSKRSPSWITLAGPAMVVAFAALVIGSLVFEIISWRETLNFNERIMSQPNLSNRDYIEMWLMSAIAFFSAVPIVAVFFTVIYRASESPSGEDRELLPSGAGGIFDLASIIRFVFPSIAFMVVFQISANFFLIMMELWFYDFFLVWPPVAASTFLLCGSWLLFPLPFLALRHRAGFIDSIALLKETWKRRFPYLVVLIFVAAAFDFISNGVYFLSRYLNSLRSSNLEACLSIYQETNPFNLSVVAISIVIQLLTFVILIRAFQSGYLDVGEIGTQSTPDAE